jgi:hypothetical protein
MKKISISIFILLIACSIYAGTDVSAGSYISFKDSNDKYSPSFIYLKAFSTYEIIKDLYFSGDMDFLYGFPSSTTLDMEFANYLNGSTRLLFEYELSDSISVGTITGLNFFSDDNSLSKSVFQGSSMFDQRKTTDISEDLFIRGSALDKKLNFFVDLGYRYQEFTKMRDLNTQTVFSGKLDDGDIYARARISYSILDLLAPFADLRFSNDLNNDTSFNLSDIRGGLSGAYKLDNTFSVLYETYYKRLQGDLINEKDRFVINASLQTHISSSFDLFFSGYLEYSFDINGNPYFVNRNLSLLGRYWIVDKKFNVIAGTTIVFDKFINDFFLRIWPVVRTEVFIFNNAGIFKNLRGYAKFIPKIGDMGKYDNISYRFDAGIISQIGYFEPAVAFRYNSKSAGNLKNLGLDISITGKF